jgi:lysozyme
MDAVSIASALARRFEGLYLSPYLCPAGVPTIGFGATYYEDGTRVTLHDAPITRERAEAMLLWMVRKVYLPAVIKLCPGAISENPGRVAALIDWTFNLGAGMLRSSTLRKKVNAGDWDAVPSEIRKWNKAGGRVLKGLMIRREAEIQVL